MNLSHRSKNNVLYNSCLTSNDFTKNNKTTIKEQFVYEFLFQDMLYNLNILCTQNMITLQLYPKDSFLLVCYQAKLSLNDFKIINKYYRLFDVINEIYSDIISLCLNKKVSIFAKEKNQIQLLFKINIRNQDEDVIIPLKNEEYSNEYPNILNSIIQDYSLIKEKCEKLAEENKNLKLYNENLNKRLIDLELWKSQYEDEFYKYLDSKLIKSCFLDSKIINDKQEFYFLVDRICGNNSILSGERIKFELLYRASRDGDSTQIFHKKCNDKGATLILVKTSKGYRFGGYTEQSWAGNEIKRDKEAFCFSLDKMKIYNIKNGFGAIGCYDYNISFSWMFKIEQNILKNKGYSYESYKSAYEGCQTDYEITMGDSRFTAVELECFRIFFE